MFPCIICCSRQQFCCVGSCNHPICFICSVRIRVLCESKECPICRTESQKIYMLRDRPRPFNEIEESRFICNDRVGSEYGFCFEGRQAVHMFHDILAHVCPVCESQPEFRSLRDLVNHMRKDHELFYCDLCVENLKLFSWERAWYDRAQLATHRRIGDADNKSHKGHPNCKFCDERYFDNDNLYRHMRRDHYFCHFCDADGISEYYNDYDGLREHFRQQHFLCEEGACKEEQFQGVFRTEIDLKGHKAAVHRGARQDRQVQLDFINYETYDSHRGRGGGGRGRGRGGGAQGRGGRPNDRRLEVDQENREPQHADRRAGVHTIRPWELPKPEPDNDKKHDYEVKNSEVEFPTLAGAVSVHGVIRGGNRDVMIPLGERSMASAVWRGPTFWVDGGQLDQNEFPSLDAVVDNGSVTLESDFTHKESAVNPSIKQHIGMRMIDHEEDEEAFPSLPGMSVAAPRRREKLQLQHEQRKTPSPTFVEEYPDLNHYAAGKSNNSEAAQKTPMKKEQQPSLKPLSSEALKSISFRDILEKPASQSGHSWVDKVAMESSAPQLKNSSDFPSLDGESKKLRGFRQTKGQGNGSSGAWKSATSTSPKNVRRVDATSEKKKKKEAPLPRPSPLAEPDFVTLKVEGDMKPIRRTLEEPPGLKRPDENDIGLPPGLFLSNGEIQPQKKKPPPVAMHIVKKDKLYLKPLQFSRRNNELYMELERNLTMDELNEFKVNSRKFKDGKLDGKGYLRSIRRFFSKYPTSAFFMTNLLVLLPNIDKQHELCEAMRSEGLPVENVSTCPECSQILAPSDFVDHQRQHSLDDADFPNLG